MVNRAPSRSLFRPRRSFALIDCIVATILLGVSLAVLIGLTSHAVNSQATGEHLSTAAMLADEQLQLVLASGPDGYAQQHSTSGDCDPPFADYKYALAFSGDGTTGVPYQITCTISWTYSGQKQSISIDTLMASRAQADTSQPEPVRTPQQPVDRTPQ